MTCPEVSFTQSSLGGSTKHETVIEAPSIYGIQNYSKLTMSAEPNSTLQGDNQSFDTFTNDSEAHGDT